MLTVQIYVSEPAARAFAAKEADAIRAALGRQPGARTLWWNAPDLWRSYCETDPATARRYLEHVEAGGALSFMGFALRYVIDRGATAEAVTY